MVLRVINVVLADFCVGFLVSLLTSRFCSPRRLYLGWDCLDGYTLTGSGVFDLYRRVGLFDSPRFDAISIAASGHPVKHFRGIHLGFWTLS